MLLHLQRFRQTDYLLVRASQFHAGRGAYARAEVSAVIEEQFAPAERIEIKAVQVHRAGLVHDDGIGVSKGSYLPCHGVAHETDARNFHLRAQRDWPCSRNIRKSEDLDGAFAALRKVRPDALLILADRVFLHNRQRMMDFTEEQRLPNVNPYKELVEAGGLMSYGPSYEDIHKRAAIYVDKILKGAKPADLPIEQPSKFTFVVNLKAGKALGVTIPPSLVTLADEVIE